MECSKQKGEAAMIDPFVLVFALSVMTVAMTVEAMAALTVAALAPFSK